MADDFLDDMIGERALANPAFPAMLDAAVRRRRQAEAEQVADSALEPK